MERTIFEFETDPSDELIERLSGLDPANPFCTETYARIRARLGANVSALVLRGDEQVKTGCLAFVTKGRLNRRLEVTSLPALSEPEIFWQGLLGHCRGLSISVLSINTFASARADLLDDQRLISKQSRNEYVIDLGSGDLWGAMNRRSRRMVTRAREAGLVLRRDSGPSAREIHAAIANQTLDRLRGRGENVDSTITADEVALMIDTGFGEIFQTVSDGTVHSTLLIVKSPSGVYCQSSGSTLEGREIGASHFIFHEAASCLQKEKTKVFNLGGSIEENKGLHDFKVGLGGVPIQLESAEYFLGGTLRKMITSGMEMLGR